MELTPQEKIRVFREEVEKRKKIEEEDSQSKLAGLTEEDRKKIVAEMDKVNCVFLSEEDITKPHKLGANVMYPFYLGVGLVFGFYGFWYWLGITIVGIIVLKTCFENAGYKIKYKCPYCSHEHNSNIYNRGDQESFRTLGYIEAAPCSNCGKDYNIFCESFFGKTDWEIKG